MDNTTSRYRAGFGLFKRIIIQPDRVIIKGFLTKKIIPSSKIANVHVNKITSRITIETSGGEKTKIFFTIFSHFYKLDEIQEKLISISPK